MIKDGNVKVVYIMDNDYYGFTKGNTYIFIYLGYFENGDIHGCLINDYGMKDYMNLKSFKLLSEIREKKLNKIFDDAF